MNIRNLILLGASFPTFSMAQVVINEVVATTAARNLRWDDNDQPFAGAGPAWWSPEFNDGDWETGSMPIGFSLGSISTNLSSDLRDVSPSFYTRKEFNASASEASSSDPLEIEISYNDGFIAWLNGVEVARRNMGANKSHIYHDQVAYRSSTLGTSTEKITLGTASSLLQEGENVIAVQVNNASLTGNMRLDFSLEIDRSGASDIELFGLGEAVTYLPGLREVSGDLVEPAQPEEGPVDWIELHNAGAAEVDLTGWTLSDDPDVPAQWTFPSGTLIGAGEFLVILANNPDEAIAGATYLHANFKLSSGGEPLALFDNGGMKVSSFLSDYPRQFPNYSYGLDSLGMEVYFATPTPGQTNSGETLMGKVDAPDFDQKGGYHDNAIVVNLTTMTPGAAIRYTTDGTEPSLENGNDYTMPLSLARISVRKGHVIRARAFLDGFIASNTKTHTFLIGQDPRVRTSPALIYAGEPQRSLYDPFGVMAINGGTYSNNQWRSTGATDYNNVINRGRAYERPIHAEFYFPDGTVGFRSDVGLRVASSSYSRPRMRLDQTSQSPWPDSPVQKPSFNLYFRDDFGNESVNLPLNGPARTFSSYERFRVRAGKNDIRNPFVIDELFRRLSHDMGNGSSLGIINSLYVNGELKGYYNMVERLREPFFQSLYRSGNEQWDVLQFEGNDNVAEGDKLAWNGMISRLGASISTSNWERILEVADVESIADYFLLNIYGATWDWPHNNWVAAKERSDAGRYRLYVWDAEGAMNNAGNRPVSQEMIRTYVAGTQAGQGGQQGTRGELRDLWRGLNRWEEFRLVFADRIHKHLFHGGILDDRDLENSHLKMRFDGLVDEFSDLLQVVEGQPVQQSKFNLWTRPNSGRRRYLFGPVREEFRDNNLWPELSPPDLSQFGGVVGQGDSLIIFNEGGTVYFTTDGSDPRNLGGGANPTATSQSGSLSEVELLPLNSEWSFNASDGDLGTAWQLLSYDDSDWGSGPGPLGYGNIRNEGTTIDIATPVNAVSPRQPTSYFRRTFEVDQASSFLDLQVTLQVDGGCVIYLNGVRAFVESNLSGEINYETEPDSDTSDGNEGDLTTFTLDSNLLVDGTNIIAIELHNNPRNSDMVLDVKLAAKKAAAANLPIFINEPMTLKARSFENGEWSALTEADFTVDSIPATSANLVIAEILYNPVGASSVEEAEGFDDGDLFEYLRLTNIGNENLDMSQVRFTDGINFNFAESDTLLLRPAATVILVANLEAFRFRYGGRYDSLIAGEYTGKLSNGGEDLRLIGEDDSIIQEFGFDNEAPWPALADLDGHSIQLVDSSEPNGEGSNWKASFGPGGTPDGTLNFTTWQMAFFSALELNDATVSGLNADPDGDGWNNFLEFALGTLPGDSQSAPSPITPGIETIDGMNYLTLSFRRAAGKRAVEFSAEISDDLTTWSDGGIALPDQIMADGSVISRFRHPSPTDVRDRFLRLKVTPVE